VMRIRKESLCCIGGVTQEPSPYKRYPSIVLQDEAHQNKAIERVAFKPTNLPN
jgi:hypothetical protein